MTRPVMFLRAWAKSPMKVGAIAPSSKALAYCMAAQVDLREEGVIVEVGAGTGAVTQGLLARGVPHDRLIVIEREKNLARVLRRQFPGLRVLCADVVHLADTLKKLEVTYVNAVVSSLPLLSMPKVVQEQIVEQMVGVIGAQGKIIQFTYGPKSPVNKTLRRKNGIYARRIKRIWMNIPPAMVWVYRKSNPQAGTTALNT